MSADTTRNQRRAKCHSDAAAFGRVHRPMSPEENHEHRADYLSSKSGDSLMDRVHSFQRGDRDVHRACFARRVQRAD